MSDTKTATGKVNKSEAEWRNELTPMQYAVLREKATERPFTGEYEHEHRPAAIEHAGQLRLARLKRLVPEIAASAMRALKGKS